MYREIEVRDLVKVRNIYKKVRGVECVSVPFNTGEECFSINFECVYNFWTRKCIEK